MYVELQKVVAQSHKHRWISVEVGTDERKVLDASKMEEDGGRSLRLYVTKHRTDHQIFLALTF